MAGGIRPVATESGARLTLLSYQATKAKRICGAAARCSNQADLHLTFTDLIRPSDLRQRPSLTAVPLATDQVVQRTAQFGSSQELSEAQ